MPSITFSDLSQMFQIRRDTVRVRQDLTTAGTELSSGKHADLGKAVSGNFGPIAAIDQQLSLLDAFDTNVTEATLFGEAVQSSLERVRTLGEGFGARMVGLLPTDASIHRALFAAEAAEAFSMVVASMNSTVAGRALFAGTSTHGNALAPAEDMLADIRAAVAGLTTAQDVIDRVEAWFAPGNEFDTTGYLGSTTDLSGFQVAEGQKISMTVRADSAAVRDQLKGFALGALMSGANVTDPGELAALANEAGTSLMGNTIRLTTLQANVGASQARIEEAGTRNLAERTTLRLARSRIADVDPYEAATRLQNLEAQLQTIYTVTARLSGLSLTNYLR